MSRESRTPRNEGWTDHEFWAVMAEMIEQAQSMPDYVSSWNAASDRYPNSEPCFGICSLINSAQAIGLISATQAQRLFNRLPKVRPQNAGAFYWPQTKWEPRVVAMRKLARLV